MPPLLERYLKHEMLTESTKQLNLHRFLYMHLHIGRLFGSVFFFVVLVVAFVVLSCF